MKYILVSLVCAFAFAGCIGNAYAAQPLRIVVYGGTGRVGQRIVYEALDRGHDVTVVVRDPSAMKAQPPRLLVIKGNVLNAKEIARIIMGTDVVICAVNFRTLAPMPWRDEAVSLVSAMRSLGAHVPRLIMVGSVGSLRTAGGALVMDAIFPPDARGAMIGQKEALDYFKKVSDVPWTYFSPALMFLPGRRTGKFRLGTDQLVTDAAGKSSISIEDYAVAVIDEAEKPAHLYRRFTIGY